MCYLLLITFFIGEDGVLEVLNGLPDQHRPESAASRLSAPAQPLVRSHVDAVTTAPTPLPAQVGVSKNLEKTQYR